MFPEEYNFTSQLQLRAMASERETPARASRKERRQFRSHRVSAQGAVRTLGPAGDRLRSGLEGRQPPRHGPPPAQSGLRSDTMQATGWFKLVIDRTRPLRTFVDIGGGFSRVSNFLVE